MVNHLLTLETFTLYNSMAGIEILDPKMDVKVNLDKVDTI